MAERTEAEPVIRLLWSSEVDLCSELSSFYLFPVLNINFIQ